MQKIKALELFIGNGFANIATCILNGKHCANNADQTWDCLCEGVSCDSCVFPTYRKIIVLGALKNE